ncbi:Uncharacterised protein [Serratia fonticola]|uniref:Uncharacterized protein n=1 Tax=Serratia fonticola TaxID=47917 RepID=A0A4U9V4P9_SERFO|nr:Uncharacterised protein [Serratia fonticola]
MAKRVGSGALASSSACILGNSIHCNHSSACMLSMQKGSVLAKASASGGVNLPQRQIPHGLFNRL